MRTYQFILKTILIVLVVALTACGGKKSETKVETEEVIPEDIVELRADQVKLANIETGTIEMRSLNGTLKVSGKVTTSPSNMASVCLPMGGFVKSISVIAGSAVSKGQILSIVENQDFIDIQQNYLEAKNKLEFAEAEYKRHSELYKDDVYSQKNVQQITSEYKSLKAQVNALKQKLYLIGINPANLHDNNIRSSIALRSPISGYIKSVNVNIGKSVSSSDVLFEIVDSSNLLLELNLFEKDADKVANGQTIRFYVNNETEQHDAIVYQTGKSIGTDKTITVYARVKELCKNVLPGMYANAVINATTNKVTAVPSDAVVSFEDKDYIFVFDKNKTEDGKPFTEYRMIQIKKGVSDEGYTEIILPDGFDYSNAKLVTKGAYNLLSAKKNAGEMAC